MAWPTHLPIVGGGGVSTFCFWPNENLRSDFSRSEKETKIEKN